jgi:hypothetical protein
MKRDEAAMAAVIHSAEATGAAIIHQMKRDEAAMAAVIHSAEAAGASIITSNEAR